MSLFAGWVERRGCVIFMRRMTSQRLTQPTAKKTYQIRKWYLSSQFGDRRTLEQGASDSKVEPMSFPLSDPVTQSIREHQTALHDWAYSSIATELHRWVGILDVEFKLNLPSYPVLLFRPLRNAYATYGWIRNEVGTRDNITFNSNELSRDPALILRTLCHELLHLWQHYHGEPATSNYHNVEFREKAFCCGLIVNPHGCTCGHNEAFTKVLAKHGVHLEPLEAELTLWGARKRSQKMKKWSCECTNVRCAKQLEAQCLRCNQSFVQA